MKPRLAIRPVKNATPVLQMNARRGLKTFKSGCSFQMDVAILNRANSPHVDDSQQLPVCHGLDRGDIP
jgi:hypothetical protein